MKRAALAALILLGTPAFAEEGPPVTDWAPNEVVVVNAAEQGPALWHLKKGDAEIYILGMVGPMPSGLAWNRTRLTQVIDGARLVYTRPTASAGFFETSWFLLTNRSLLSLPDGKKLEETLPPDLKARFIAARTALKLDAKHFDDDPPILAALKLENVFNAAHKLADGEVTRAVDKIADDKDVKMRPIGEYGALGMIKEMLRLPQDKQQACLAAVVRDVELRREHAVPAAEAWAVGDLKGIKAHYTPPVFEACAKPTVSFNKLYERSVADYTAAINDALSKPGKTVMMMDVGSLLRNSGVADKLRAQGVTIEGPAE